MAATNTKTISQPARARPAAYEWLWSPQVLLAVYVVAAAAATASKLLHSPFVANGHVYPPLQNFAIFRNSFGHLIHGQDIYAKFPNEQWDVFKYGPVFALLMAPISILPYGLGALVWNLVNALALLVAVELVPEESEERKAWVLWFALVSLFVSLQNSQSNGLMAGLMIGGWVAQRRGKPLLGSFCIALSVFIKLFGGLAVLPCLLIDRGRTKLIAFGAMWGMVMALAPLAVLRPSQLAALYRSWYVRLQTDDAVNTGRSLLGLLRKWLHQPVSEHLVLAAGAIVLLAVLAARYDARGERRFQLLAVASVLLWVILFNHMAESATMVIAVAGVGMWFAFQEPSGANLALLALTFLFTCLTPTSIWPKAVRNAFESGYLDVAPLAAVWIKLQFDLLRFPKTRDRNAAA